jgi:hypothetical protein
MIFEEPPCNTEVYVGKFFYNDATGEEVIADFFVRCCAEIESVEEYESEEAFIRRSRREVEYNEQWAHQFEALDHNGCTNIRYEPIKPNPIL